MLCSDLSHQCHGLLSLAVVPGPHPTADDAVGRRRRSMGHGQGWGWVSSSSGSTDAVAKQAGKVGSPCSSAATSWPLQPTLFYLMTFGSARSPLIFPIKKGVRAG